MESNILTELIKWGPSGVIAALAITAWWKERAKVDELNEKRLEDHREFSKVYYELAKDTDATLRTALEALERGRFK